MTDNEIIENGYREYRKTPFDKDGIEKKFSKRFCDENGIKYFIHISKWEKLVHPHTGEVFPNNYEFDTQMYAKGTHKPINMYYLAGWEINEVEEYFEKLFDTGMFDYYETSDGTREGQ